MAVSANYAITAVAGVNFHAQLAARIGLNVTTRENPGESMSDPRQYQATPGTGISAEAMKKAEEFIEEEEGASHQFRGAMAVFLTAVAVLSSVFHL